MDTRIKEISALKSELLFDIIIDLETPLNFGDGPVGRRVLYTAVGGTFSGPAIKGKVLPGGGDWALFSANGTMTLDVRLSLQTDDGDLILTTYKGRLVTPPEHAAAMADPASRSKIDPENYYFRTRPLFETGSEKYAWLNDVVCIGKGYVVDGGVAYRVFRIL